MPTSTNSNSPRATRDTIEWETINNALASLPSGPVRARAIDAARRLIEGSNRRTNILELVQEALSQLRLDMKYLIFDLEATRRERDAYREELDNGK